MCSKNISTTVIMLILWVGAIQTLPKQHVINMEKNLGEFKVTTRPTIECNKKSFVDNFLKNGHHGLHLTNGNIEELKKCSEYSNKCNQWPGTITVSLVQSADGKLNIFLNVNELIEQDCWGYAVQIRYFNNHKAKEIEKTYYLNFDEEKKNSNIEILFPTKWNTTYELTVIPLPTGKPLSAFITSPTKCQLKVLDVIYDKIAKGSIYGACNSEPDYESRKKIAEEICATRQTEELDTLTIAKRYLYEENCKMMLELF